jgi:putative phosphoribosyl transferase
MEGLFGMAVFEDRCDAGRRLSAAVDALPDLRDPIVLALPRGGVPVGYEVAHRLGAPLDVLIVRKLGVPGREELALGAVAGGGIVYRNQPLIDELGIPALLIDQVRAREEAEVERRAERYRGSRAWPRLDGRSVVVVDDGAATGATVLAAIAALRPQQPSEIVVALPVAPAETCDQLREAADRVVCLIAADLFFALGSWYADFEQVSDDEVRDLLARAPEAIDHRARVEPWGAAR